MYPWYGYQDTTDFPSEYSGNEAIRSDYDIQKAVNLSKIVIDQPNLSHFKASNVNFDLCNLCFFMPNPSSFQ